MFWFLMISWVIFPFGKADDLVYNLQLASSHLEEVHKYSTTLKGYKSMNLKLNRKKGKVLTSSYFLRGTLEISILPDSIRPRVSY